jgi:hypothetical protein
LHKPLSDTDEISPHAAKQYLKLLLFVLFAMEAATMNDFEDGVQQTCVVPPA